MARTKTNLAWISNNKLRRATMKKRRSCLVKKVSELATLCDVKASAVIYSPDEPQPEVWPSEQEARNILQCLKSMPESKQSKKMMDQEGYLRQRIAKLEEQLVKEQREDNELQMRLLLCGEDRSWVNEMGFEDVVVLDRMICERVEAVGERIEVMKAAEELKEGGRLVVPTSHDDLEEEEEEEEEHEAEPGRATFWLCSGDGGLEDVFLQSCAEELADGGLMTTTTDEEEQEEEGRSMALSIYGGSGGLEDVFLQSSYGLINNGGGGDFASPSQTPWSFFNDWQMDFGSFF